MRRRIVNFKGLCLLIALPAFADLITVVSPTVTPSLTGFRYAYSFANDEMSSGSIFDISFTGFSGDLTDISAPAGWTFITAAGFIDWSSTDNAFDIGPGTALDGFGFVSQLGPLTGQYFAIAIDSATGIAGDFSLGEVPVPGTTNGVPEPSTLSLFGSALALIGCLRHRCLRFKDA